MRRSECVWAVTITWEGNLETMVYHDYLVCLLHPSSALLKPRFFLLYTLIWHHSLHLAVFALRFVTVCDVCSTLNEFHAPLAKTQLANLSMENIVGCFNFSRIFFFCFFIGVLYTFVQLCIPLTECFFPIKTETDDSFSFSIYTLSFAYLYVNGVALNRLEKNSATVNM